MARSTVYAVLRRAGLNRLDRLHRVTREPVVRWSSDEATPGIVTLSYRAGDDAWTGLRDDVSFRVGPYGRIEFTVDGEDWYVQYMPACMADIESGNR